MYDYLEFSTFDITRNFCFNTNCDLIAMLNVNQSPFLLGYHGYKHVLYCLNTFSFLTDKHYEKDENNNLIWYPLKEDLLDTKLCSLDNEYLNTLVTTLIWHDCNYLYPDDDAENTRIAINSFTNYYNNLDQEKQEVLDFDKIVYYINQLRFPLPYNFKTSKYEIADDPYVYVLRDCDLSGMLYKEYFDENQLFHRLLTHEFIDYTKEELKDLEVKYINNLSYYTPYLTKVLNKIGKQTLLNRAFEAIDKFVK